jgi:hypothetical protein
MIIFKRVLFIIIALACLFFYDIFRPRRLPGNILNATIENQNQFKCSIKNKDVVIIIDYNKPIWARRLWLYDMVKHKVILNSHVTHAIKSGLIFPRRFSNKPKSNLSCFGSFITAESYHGKYGNSMRIIGLDEVHNSNAYERAIVFHSSKYKINLFYSLGCFCTPEGINKEIINITEEGTLICVFKENRLQ